ncbi:hypothetical protein BMS3Bbin15_01183 [archaeon BMS3Bbin15]|nr:hypothetical protein BMS3Bbin15_01183 [archaeon BMS3Bbin15]
MGDIVVYKEFPKLYKNKDEFLRDAYEAIAILKPEKKIEFAIWLYKEGIVSLERASEIAGLSLFEFKEVLKVKGIKIEIDDI